MTSLPSNPSSTVKPFAFQRQTICAGSINHFATMKQTKTPFALDFSRYVRSSSCKAVINYSTSWNPWKKSFSQQKRKLPSRRVHTHALLHANIKRNASSIPLFYFLPAFIFLSSKKLSFTLTNHKISFFSSA